MKKLLGIVTLAGATLYASAQGTVNFVNTSGTLLSAGGTSMLSRNNGGTYYFAVFLAPSTTVTAAGQASTLTDPNFQIVGTYNTNSATANGALVNRAAVDVGTSRGYQPGTTVDFIVRGWSANAGLTWAEALAFYNGGSPAADMWIGQSLVGNDILLGGGAIGNTALFGVGIQQIGGFNMPLVPSIPEPSSMVLAGLGAASLLLFRRRK